MSAITIGKDAFYGCSGLTTVTIPSGVTTIGKDAFSTIAQKSVIFYDGENLVDDNTANDNYDKTRSIIAKYGTPLLDADKKCTINGATFTFTCSTSGQSATATLTTSAAVTGEVTLPACVILNGTSYSVTAIDELAFLDCTALTSITLPSSVTTIRNSAFYGCTGLTAVTIPSSVTAIGSFAFCGCTGLTSVTIPSNVTTISDLAFGGCTGLTSVTIPDSVTTIDDFAFDGCTGLTSVTIPDSVKTIDGSAFQGCTGLTSVTIPNSVTQIGQSAFKGCKKLKVVDIAASSIETIEDFAFENLADNAIIYYDGEKLEKGTHYNGTTTVVKRTLPVTSGEQPNQFVANSIPVQNEGTGGSIGAPTPPTCNMTFEKAGSGNSFTISEIDLSGVSSEQASDGNLQIALPANISVPGSGGGDSTTLSASQIDLSAINVTLPAAAPGAVKVTLILPNGITTIGTPPVQNTIPLTGFAPFRRLKSVFNRYLGTPTLSSCLETLVIPNTVTTIGTGAFTNFNELKEIDITPGAASISFGADAFNGIANNSVIWYDGPTMDQGYYDESKTIVVPHGALVLNADKKLTLADGNIVTFQMHDVVCTISEVTLGVNPTTNSQNTTADLSQFTTSSRVYFQDGNGWKGCPLLEIGNGINALFVGTKPSKLILPDVTVAVSALTGLTAGTTVICSWTQYPALASTYPTLNFAPKVTLSGSNYRLGDATNYAEFDSTGKLLGFTGGETTTLRTKLPKQISIDGTSATSVSIAVTSTAASIKTGESTTISVLDALGEVQWYKSTSSTANGSAYSTSTNDLSISGLTVGTYYFYCMVGNVKSNVVTITVTSAGGSGGGSYSTTYTLTLNADGGTVSKSSVSVQSYSPYASLPTPTKDGFTFLGWFTASGTEVTSKTYISSSMTLTARWEQLVVSTAPENLRQANGNAITFDAVDKATSYAIYLDGEKATTTANTLYCFQGLTAGQVYTIDVAPVFADGTEGDKATVKLTAVAILNKPANLSRVNNVLTWDAVSDAKNYQVWVIDAETNRFLMSDTTTDTSYTFASLVEGKTYQLRVCAIDANSSYGRSATTTPAFVYKVLPIVSTAPENLRQANGNAIAFDAVDKATSYAIYLDGKKATTTANTLYCFQGLTAGQVYTIDVAPVFADGTEGDKATVKLTAVALLNKPANLKRDGNLLTWDAVAGAVKYRVWVIDTQTNRFVASRSGITDTSYRFNSLVVGKSYQLRVVAIDADGNYGRSTTTTPAFVYEAPQVVSNAPENLRTLYGNAVAFDAVDKAVSYNIYLDGKKATSTANTLYNFQNLNNDQTYTIEIAAVFADGTEGDKASVKLTAVTMLRRPQNVARNGNVLSWNAIDGAVKYRVWVIDADTNRFVASNSNVKDTAYTFSTLKDGKNYRLRVCAIDKNGVLGNTFTSAAFTYEAAPEVKQAPAVENLANVCGNGVSWRSVEGIDKYNIYIDGVLTKTTVNTSYVFQTFTAGKSYTIGISYMDADGAESEIAEVSFKAVSLLAKPTGLKRDGRTLSWNAVEGATKYKVYVIDAQTDKIVTFNANVSKTGYTFTKLVAGKQYKLRVCAIDKNGYLGRSVTTKTFTA